MRISQLIVSFFLFFAFASALPLQAPVESDALDGHDVLETRAGSKKEGNSKGGGNSNAAKKTAKGIDKNINIQKQESKDANKLKKSEGTKNFGKDKTKLQSDVKAGQKQRAQNQKTAPKSNKQLNDGLKKVQGAQAKESKQAASLKGDNSKKDKATLNKLSGEFKDGKKQNEKNKQAALKGGNKPKKGGK